MAIEYVERDLMERTAKHIGKIWPVTTGKYYLLIIVGEDTRDEVLSKSLRISEICKRNTTFEIFAAESAADQENILSIRSNLYTVLKPDVLDILDIVVPISKIEQIVETVEEISKETGVSLPLYGHAGDGNLHVHIMRKQGEQFQNMDVLTDKIYKATMALGGVITGEHGIGKTRTEKVGQFLEKGEIELIKKLKCLFDPNNIMNPGTKVAS